MNTNKNIEFFDEVTSKYEQLLEKPTVYLNDYRVPVIDPEVDKSNKTRSNNEVPVYKSEKESDTKFKIPFDFYFEKPSASNPLDTLEELNRKVDDNTRLTRPRVYKCPEVSLDDITDKELREKITKFVYSSETHTSLEETMATIRKKTGEKENDYRKCLDTSLLLNEHEKLLRNSVARKLSFPEMEPPSPEIKPDDFEDYTGKLWDRKQERLVGEPTKRFWAKASLHGPDYDPTNMPMSEELKKEVIEMIRNDKIRYPHLHDSFTASFKPEYSHKLQFEKHEISPFDFWFTTNQFYGKHYRFQKKEGDNGCLN